MNAQNAGPWATILGFFLIATSHADQPVPAPGSLLPGGADQWTLVWSDEFDGTEEELDQRWVSQNGPSGHILSSRWRENVSVNGGTLKLTNRKESRGGQDWTSGSIWSKDQFTYGYFECRYRYAAAAGTNNSFWLMTRGKEPEIGKRFEIDINEGHYPNEVNTNIHNWSDITVVNGKKTHPSHSKSFPFGVQPDRIVQLEIPITTRKIRLISNQQKFFHIGEFQIFNVNEAGYPDVLKDGDRRPGLINFAADPKTKVTVSGSYQRNKPRPLSVLNDGKTKTTWVSQEKGEKWIEFTFVEEKTVGCIQFVNGWESAHGWERMLTEYKVQYHNGTEWVEMAAFDLASGKVDFARDFHTYGLDWNKDEIIFYFNGEELRREKNEFCFSPSPVWLSLAIIKWAGEVSDAIDGTMMEVDYVRIYKPKG